MFFYGLLVGRVFANSQEDRGSIPACVIPMTLKMALDTSLLYTQQYKVRIKWSSYWKGNIPVTLDYGHQLYFLHIDTSELGNQQRHELALWGH